MELTPSELTRLVKVSESDGDDEPAPEDHRGDVFTLDQFYEIVTANAFVDSDGSGYLSAPGVAGMVQLSCKELCNLGPAHPAYAWATHVHWFSK